MTEPRKLRPDEVWDLLVDMAIDEAAERLDAMSPAEVARELAAQGRKPEEVKAKARALIARLETKTAAPVKKTRPRTVLWMLAAALGAVAVLLMTEWPRVMALFKHETPTIGPDSEEPVRYAAKLRDDARVACQQREWAVCLTKLDEAKRYDPVGETSAPVRAMREAIKVNTMVDAQTPLDDKRTPYDDKGTGPGMKRP